MTIHEEREHSLYLAVTRTISLCHVRKLLLCESPTCFTSQKEWTGNIAYYIHTYEYIVASLQYDRNNNAFSTTFRDILINFALIKC